MTKYLIVEGPTDAIVLGTIINALGIQDVLIVPAGGKPLATSLARSVALSKKAPVAVVVDSDTTDPSAIRQYESVFNDLTNRSGSPYLCKLFQAIPTLEEDLFKDADDLSLIFSSTPAKLRGKAFESGDAVTLKTAIRDMTIHSQLNSIDHIDTSRVDEMLERSGLRGLVAYLRAPEESLVTADASQH